MALKRKPSINQPVDQNPTWKKRPNATKATKAKSQKITTLELTTTSTAAPTPSAQSQQQNENEE